MMKMDILKGLSSEELRRFRKLFLNAVLATDLTHHMELINKLQVRNVLLSLVASNYNP
jgi:hypothetical protein